jgi:hypothetical protein
MFAPKVARPQMKAATNSTNRLVPHHSVFATRPFGGGTVEQAHFLQRAISNQATPRLLAQRASQGDQLDDAPAHESKRMHDGSVAPGLSWDFGKTPLFPPELASRSQGLSPRPTIIQPKLVVGPANDPLEHEADRIADQVMRMPDPVDGVLAVNEVPRTRVQRACAACDEEPPRTDVVDGGMLGDRDQDIPVDTGQPLVSASPGPDDAEPLSPTVREQHIGILRKPVRAPDTGVVVVDAPLAGTIGATSEGRPLEVGARAFFEQRFGHTFNHVRVHTDAHAAESTQAVNALAYTVGSDIVFAPGRYAPGTATGQRLLAHELAHVLQQDPPPARPGSPAAASGAAQLRAKATGILQRWSADGPADTSKNTIVCDGSGGIRVQIGTGNDPTGLACMRDCLTNHEASHRADALAANATVCTGKADGSQVNFGTGEQKPSEIKASQVEIDCLNTKLPAASAACKPRVQARITQMIAYRDSFR